jgi:hypothetical protein
MESKVYNKSNSLYYKTAADLYYKYATLAILKL